MERRVRARNPRVLIVSRIYWPEPAAASLRLGALEAEFLRNGWDVKVLTSTTDFLDADAGAAAAVGVDAAAAVAPPTTGLGVGGEGVGKEGTRQRGQLEIKRWNTLRDSEGYVRGYLPYLSFDIPAFFRVLAAGRADLVVVEPPPTTGIAVRVAAALRRLPYAYFAADVWSEAVREVGVSRAVHAALRTGERFAISGALRTLTVYPGMAERVRALAPRARVVNIGHGADVTAFRPDGPDAGFEHPYLVYAGTASEVHGAGIFVAAMGEVLAAQPDARLVVIGQGEERAAMESAAGALPAGTVTFLPRLSPETTASWLRGARAALASVRPGPYEFAVATKVYAATACGVPVVYAGTGEGADLVGRNALGETVPYDVRAVAAAMIRALRGESPALARGELAAWARSHASLEAVAGRAIRELTEALVARRG